MKHPDFQPDVILDEDLLEEEENELIAEMRGVASEFIADADFSVPPSRGTSLYVSCCVPTGKRLETANICLLISVCT